jgi:hypothetical protein
MSGADFQHLGKQKTPMKIHKRLTERVTGIEPVLIAWEAIALPIDHTRKTPLILPRWGGCVKP